MKKLLAATLLVTSTSSFGQWIVNDPIQMRMHIMNQVETIGKWAQQSRDMAVQIQQYEQQYKAITGSRGLGNIMNNPAVQASLPSDIRSLIDHGKKLSGFSTERAKYPTIENRPKLNQMYDTMAAQNATMGDLFQKSNQRMKQIQSLMSNIDSASDPAAKQDLANRIASEQNNITATQQLVSNLQAQQKIQLEEAKKAAEKEMLCKEFNKTNC